MPGALENARSGRKLPGALLLACSPAFGKEVVSMISDAGERRNSPAIFFSIFLCYSPANPLLFRCRFLCRFRCKILPPRFFSALLPVLCSSRFSHRMENGPGCGPFYHSSFPTVKTLGLLRSNGLERRGQSGIGKYHGREKHARNTWPGSNRPCPFRGL
jgi:hypothetical protein